MSLDAFKASVPIADIVGRYVKLTKKGRDLWGCCPFHSEKTPSFHVVPDRSYYHCFGCGVHGNAIDFIMELEKLEFREAIERLSALTGITAPTPVRREANAIAPSLYEMNARASRWFVEQLMSAAGRQARLYLSRRGLHKDDIARFRIGYAPDGGQALRTAFKDEGVADDLLLQTGLIARSDRNNELYDRFRDRVMFPILDQNDRVRGFGGRALSSQTMAKYLNTAETEIFKKGQLLYGQNHAAKAARQHDALIVVEGYLDVIALVKSGLENAVAPLGTAMTEEQLALAWRYAETPLLCFDGDEAGIRAAGRVALKALPLLRPGRSIAFCLLPEGEDPDSLYRERGAEDLKAQLGDKCSLADLLWRQETSGFVGDTPEARAGLEQRFQALVATISDRTVKYQYQQEFRDRLRTLWQQRRERNSVHRRSGTSTISRSQQVMVEEAHGSSSRLAIGLRDPEWLSQAALLAPLLKNPWLLRHTVERLAEIELSDTELDALRQELIEWSGRTRDLDAEVLKAHLVQYGCARALDRLRKAGCVSKTMPDGDSELLASWMEAAGSYERRLRWRREVDELEQQTLSQGSTAVSAQLSDLLRWSEIEQDADNNVSGADTPGSS